MPTIEYPEQHKNDVWNVPDGLFHISHGLLLGGKQAAKRLGVCKQILYRDADDLDLTVVRRNCLHGGRYFLVTEIENLIRQEQRRARKFGRKSVLRTAQRGY